MKRTLSLFVAVAALLFASCGTAERYDIVIAGGGASGIAAGLQAARMGSRTLLVEEFDWLGGMLTSAGVSATDGNYRLRGGIWGEFRDALAEHYGGDAALKTGWVSNVMFEPSVGDALFKELAAREPNLSVEYRSQVVAAVRKEDKWQLTVACGDRLRKIEAAVLIDATELGDIAALCGVPWDKGMDAAAETGEDIAPAEANGIIQDLTYVAVLKEYGRDVALPEPPEGYDPALFACCCINPLCINPKEPDRMWPKEMMITYGKLPNGKFMINWPIEGNDYYADLVELSPGERAEAVRRAKNHTLGFVYFLQHELGFRTLGLADDEFPTDDGLPFIPYHRESRRIRGAVRFTLRDICEPYAGTLYRTAAGVGDYPVDQHHTRYSGWDALPDLHFHPIPSYGFPLGIVLPEGHPGLLVAEKSVSVTNIVNGSTRLQPVVLQIGQAAGALASLAVQRGIEPHEVPVRAVQEALLAAGGYLLPYLDLPVSDPRFGAVQRIGVTGILKGRGANVGWENQSWFDIDEPVSVSELRRGLHEVWPDVALSEEPAPVCGASLAAMLAEAVACDAAQIEALVGDMQHPLTRLECAVAVDAVADPFHAVPVDICGRYAHEQQVELPAASPEIRFVGRTERDAAGGVTFDWSGTWFECGFTGRSVAVRVSDTHKNYYNVFIDGEQTAVVSTFGRDSVVMLAEGLAAGPHTLRMQKRTEAEQGRTTIHALLLEGGGILTPLPVPGRHIEFIGDSLTCGYGTEGASANDPFLPETENCDKAYGCISARYFGADYTLIAHSGRGVARNYGDEHPTSQNTMADRIARLFDETPDSGWDFAGSPYRPDIVVINLGTNDFSTRPHPSEEQFAAAYTGILQTLRRVYGEAVPILCVAPRTEEPAFAYIRAICDTSELPNISFAALFHDYCNDSSDLGSSAHPNYAGQRKMAMALIPYIATLTGWEAAVKPLF